MKNIIDQKWFSSYIAKIHGYNKDGYYAFEAEVDHDKTALCDDAHNVSWFDANPIIYRDRFGWLTTREHKIYLGDISVRNKTI